MRRALSTIVIALFLPGFGAILLVLAIFIVAFAICYRAATGKAPYWCNCVFKAAGHWLTQVRRDWPTRDTSNLPPGGFVAACVSCYGNFPHVMWSPDQETWYAYMPVAEHVHRVFPPLTFVGEVRAGQYRRDHS